MILVTDADGIIVDANKTAQEMLSAKTIFDLIGCSLDEFLLRGDTLSQLMKGSESVMRLSLPGSGREVELSMSRIAVDGNSALVFIGRDIGHAKNYGVWRRNASFCAVKTNTVSVSKQSDGLREESRTTSTISFMRFTVISTSFTWEK